MNEEQKGSLFTTFLQDSELFIREFNRDLIELEKQPRSVDLMNRLFRTAHSLKSEADYLDLPEIAQEAHRIETALENIKYTHSFPTSEQFDEFFVCIDRIQEMIELLKNQYAMKKTATRRSSLLGQAARVKTGTEKEPPAKQAIRLSPHFNDFEKVLLRESMERNEKFFRVGVEMDADTSMPYAKAYLILSNLEQIVQVVHTQPEFSGDTDQIDNRELFLEPVFYCTGDVREAEIYKAVNVDQVKSIGISPLEYRSILEGPKKERTTEEYQPSFNVQIDGGALDDLNSYVDELKIRAHRLKRDLSGGSDEIKRQLIILTDLVDDLEKFARKISLVQLSEILQYHRRLVRDQARKMDKDVQLVLKNCDITVDRRAAELISEMVVHLLRNAVVHGIESPVERTRKNKRLKGTITIEASMRNGQLQVSVGDDGAGIDQEKIRQAAYEKGVKIKETGEMDEMSLLMSYLVYPGVSTHGDADAQAGRGFGLDIVYQKVQQFEGGSISVSTKPGEGTTFSIRLPSGFSIIPLLVARYKQKMYALPAKYIEREITDISGSYSAGESGEMLWDGLNVFTPEGRLFYTDTPPEQSIGIEISYLKKKALVLVDEILFRKEVPEDSMTLYIAGSPNVHKMDLYGVPSDFYYLSPSMVAT